jgi:hypothetical protein
MVWNPLRGTADATVALVFVNVSLLLSQGRRPKHSREGVFCLLLDPLQMLSAQETLGINFINILRAGGSRGEPAIFRNDLDSPDRRSVARGGIQCRAYSFTGEFRHTELIGCEVLQQRLLPDRPRCVDPLVERDLQFARETVENFARIPARSRGDLSGD